MSEEEATNLSAVRRYLTELQSGHSGEALRAFFTEDVLQVEFPNRLNPTGASSDLATILERSIRGQKLLESQTYAVVSEMVQGNRAAIEAHWSGVLGVPLGALKAGTTLQAHFAMFFLFRDGRISSQRNYDCFEPW